MQAPRCAQTYNATYEIWRGCEASGFSGGIVAVALVVMQKETVFQTRAIGGGAVEYGHEFLNRIAIAGERRKLHLVLQADVPHDCSAILTEELPARLAVAPKIQQTIASVFHGNSWGEAVG